MPFIGKLSEYVDPSTTWWVKVIGLSSTLSAFSIPMDLFEPNTSSSRTKEYTWRSHGKQYLCIWISLE